MTHSEWSCFKLVKSAGKNCWPTPPWMNTRSMGVTYIARLLAGTGVEWLDDFIASGAVRCGTLRQQSLLRRRRSRSKGVKLWCLCEDGDSPLDVREFTQTPVYNLFAQHHANTSHTLKVPVIYCTVLWFKTVQTTYDSWAGSNHHFIHSLHILFDVWHRTQRIRQNPWLFHAVPARFNGFVSVIFGDFNLKFVSSKQRSAHKCIKTKEYDIMSYVKTSETFRNTTKHYMACQVKSMAPKLVEVMRSCKVGDQAMLPFWYLVEWIVPSARWKWLDIWDMFGNMCFFFSMFF